MILKRNQNPMRAAATLAVIISIMVAASSSAWAESKPASKAESKPASKAESESWYKSWYEGFDAQPGYWSGTLGLTYQNGQQSITSPHASTRTSTNSDYRESLKIANSGFYVLSPLLCTGNMSLDLQFNQDKSGGAGGGTASQGQLVGYAIDATFLAEKPYTASVFANRSQIQMVQPFGARMVGTNENLGAMLHLRQDSILNDWGYHWVEANLDLRQGHNQSTMTNFGRSQSSDEQSRTLDFNASKGFETADLVFNYQFNDHQNAGFSQGNFQSMAAGLNYSLDFGPTLNRRFDSTLNYLTLTGVSPTTTITNSEHLHIDHYQNLNTDYQYGFNSSTTGDISSTVQNGAFSVSHQLYQNLHTSAGANGSLSTFSGGTMTTYGGHLGQGYHHSLPDILPDILGKGSFSLNWSGSYQLSSNKLIKSSISAFDEVHNAPSPFGAGVGFLLDHNFAVATGIVVLNVRGGGRIPTTAGIDYDVINENNQIKIVPLAGSLLILPGDPLAVSYNYRADANLQYASTSTGFGMGIDYRWISFMFSHQESTQEPLNGTTSQFLQSTQQNLVQINTYGTILGVSANGNTDFEDFKSTTTAYQRSKFGTSLIWDIQSNLRMNFGLTTSESNYTLPVEHQSTSHSARSSLNWFTSGGWVNTVSVDWSNHKDSGMPAETLVQALAQTSVKLGKLSVNANLSLGEWLRGGSCSTNRGFNISIAREL